MTTGPSHPLAVTTWDGAEQRAAQAVLDSGQTTMGPKVEAFEATFAGLVGSRYAVMVNSGSSANLLAVAALFYTDPPLARAGAVAIVPAVSWATTYYPLTQYGLTLRFVDIDPDTLNFDLPGLAKALDEDVAVVFAVNLLGNANDYTAIHKLLAGRNITLLEDNCEALGARFDGRWTGTFGRIGTFSSFFSHHMSTMEGGVCVTDDEALWHNLLALRSHGWTRHLPQPNHVAGAHVVDGFHAAFQFVLPGYNVRPLEVSAAIGLEQLKKLPGFIAQRRQNAALFASAMAEIPGVRLQREIGDSSSFGFAVTLTEAAKCSRSEVVAVLQRGGVETRPIVAGNFTRNPVMRWLAHEPPSPLPNADRVHDHGFYIGNHAVDLSDVIGRVRDMIGTVAG